MRKILAAVIALAIVCMVVAIILLSQTPSIIGTWETADQSTYTFSRESVTVHLSGLAPYTAEYSLRGNELTLRVVESDVRTTYEVTFLEGILIWTAADGSKLILYQKSVQSLGGD